MNDEFNLSPIQLDALREIGNVGAGNSATALSQIINKRIDMNVPKVALVPIESVPDLVGGPDAIVVGVFLRIYGKAPGNVLFLLPQKSAFYLVDTLMGREHGTTKSLDFMDESALMSSSVKWAIRQWLSRLNFWRRTTGSTDISSLYLTPVRLEH